MPWNNFKIQHIDDHKNVIGFYGTDKYFADVVALFRRLNNYAPHHCFCNAGRPPAQSRAVNGLSAESATERGGCAATTPDQIGGSGVTPEKSDLTAARSDVRTAPRARDPEREGCER